jgi:hypothetical protein
LFYVARVMLDLVRVPNDRIVCGDTAEHGVRHRR